MSATGSDRLYELLPVIYRRRDAELGEPLRALLAVIAEELQLLEDDISRLYENWFIETCDEWLVPYLGDLLGVRNLHPLPAGVFSQRAYVADTLALRRRKGTAAVLERLARVVTGWPAKSVEFFELLGTTQYLNHVRPGKGGTVDLREANRLELLGGPFERTAHTAEVRHIDNGRGRYNLPNLGVFLWRLQDYRLDEVTARAVTSPGDRRYTFHPLGLEAPLCNTPRTETQITQLADEVNVPGPLRRRPLYDELEAWRQALAEQATPVRRYFGENPVFQIHLKSEEKPVPSQQILICNLEGWQRPSATKTYRLPNGTTKELPIRVAVDPVLGRLAFPAAETPGEVKVTYAYGFSGDVGGGPYGRRRPPAQEDAAQPDTVTDPRALDLRLGVPSEYDTLTKALAAWNTPDNRGKATVIELEDNATYGLGPEGLAMLGDRLVIQAKNTRRPCLVGDIAVLNGGDKASLTLNGLLINGNLQVQGTLAELKIIHCTLAPGTPEKENKLFVNSAHDRLQLTIEHSIVGPLRLPGEMAGLTVRDSIIQALADPPIALAADDIGGTPGPPATLERTTIFGKVHVKELVLASEVIFTGRVTAARHQTGCVRFSFVPAGSRTPRRYRCQPDLALAQRAEELQWDSVQDLPEEERSPVLARLQPGFTSRQYGQPAYAQLSGRCAEEIRTGAEDGSEMGVFSQLKQPQRLANLRAGLEEYLRFGLEAGIFLVT